MYFPPEPFESKLRTLWPFPYNTQILPVFSKNRGILNRKVSNNGTHISSLESTFLVHQFTHYFPRWLLCPGRGPPQGHPLLEFHVSSGSLSWNDPSASPSSLNLTAMDSVGQLLCRMAWGWSQVTPRGRATPEARTWASPRHIRGTRHAAQPPRLAPRLLSK